MYDITVFDKSLETIQDHALRHVVSETLKRAPSYFWTVPASSTGKYHPQESLGEGGLIRHTLRTLELLNGLCKYFRADYDICASAMHVHDVLKYGKTTKPDYDAYKEHDLAASLFFQEVCFRESIAWNTEYMLRYVSISRCILRHMGTFGTEYPRTVNEIVCHLADYISAQRIFEVKPDFMFLDQRCNFMSTNMAA